MTRAIQILNDAQDPRAASPSPQPTLAAPKSTTRLSPLVPILAAVSLGIIIDRFAEPLATKTSLVVAGSLAIVAFVISGRTRLASITVLLSTLFLGAAHHHSRWSDLPENDVSQAVSELPRPVWIQGAVLDFLGTRKSPSAFGADSPNPVDVSSRFLIDLTAISDGARWQPAAGRAIAIVTGDVTGIRGGESIEAAGQLATIPGPLNPGEFDYRAFLRGQGIRLRLTVDEPASFSIQPANNPGFFAPLLGQLKAWSRAQLTDQLDPATAPLAAALLLGQRDAVDPEINDAFARTGTTHLLAISGLQLQALSGAMLILFLGVGLPRRPAYIAVGMGTIGYALLVGLAPSVVRSAIMTLTFCIASLAMRQHRPANTLALAALATLAVNPVFLFDVGCQLSFIAIASIFWLVPPGCSAARASLSSFASRFRRPPTELDKLEASHQPVWRKLPKRLAMMLFDGVIASAVVWLAAIPLVALRFHIVSPIGILLNIPLIPITSAAMLLGGFGLAVSSLSSTAASLFTGCAGLLLHLTQLIVVWGVNQSWGHRFVAGPSPEWVILFYIILAIATLSIADSKRRSKTTPARQQTQPGSVTLIPSRRPSAVFASLGLLAIWPVPAWLWSLQIQPLSAPQVDFLAVGHGLAIVIRTPDNQTYLYDCGRMGDASVGRRVIAPALWSLGLTHVDQIFLSHADQDHYDGLPDLLDRFSIGRVRIPPGFGGLANPDAVKLLEQIGRKGIRIEPIAAPDSWESGQTQFRVLHPPRGWNPDASDNAHSLILDIAYQGRHLLLTGDLEQQGMLDLVGEPFPDPPPEVVLAPHHGGRAANPEWFYDWTNPRTVVVSQRALPPGSNDALAPIEQRGIPLLRTWRDGAIRATWTSTGILTQTHILPPVNASSPPPTMPKIPWLSIAIALLGFSAGLVTWAILTVIEFGAWTLILPPRREPGSESSPEPAAPETAPTAEPITATTPAGTKLSARWYPAQGDAPTGRTILLLHGFAEPTTAWESARAPILSRDGWNVAAIDARGYGNSQPHLSSFGAHEAEDVSVWLDLLRSNQSKHHPDQPFTPVLWGRSMGSLTALRTAAADPSIAGLILESPLVDVIATVTSVLRARHLPFPRLLARLMLHRAGSRVKANLTHPAPVELAAQIPRPTLIIHGENDRLIPVVQAQRLAAAFPSPPRWITVPAAGHSNVITVGGERLLAQIVEFLDETF